MKYTIEFELPDDEIFKRQIKHCPVHWQIWGFCGDIIAKPKEETADTPQTETQTETQNSNLTFEKADERCKGCNHYKLTCDLFSEICRYEPKDEPQTGQLCDGCEYSEPYIEYKCTHPSCKYGDEHQTEREGE